MDYLETVAYFNMLYIGKLAKIRLVMRFLYTNDFIRSCTDTLFKTKIDEIDTPFKTKPSKNHTLSGRTSPLRPYKGVPPRVVMFILTGEKVGRRGYKEVVKFGWPTVPGLVVLVHS